MRTNFTLLLFFTYFFFTGLAQNEIKQAQAEFKNSNLMGFIYISEK
jgi:hypothetical protein